MGYRKVPTIYTLDDINGEDGLIVRMKGIRVGKLRRLISNDSDDNVGEVLDLLLEGLVSWNLEDENGAPVPMTLEGLESQELPMITAIVDSWTDKVTGVSDELGKDSPAGEKFPGQPLTMEAL